MAPGGTRADSRLEHPFPGVTHITRTESSPRTVVMHVIVVDLATPGLRFRLTPPAGPLETRKQTTLAYLTEQKAQVAFNVHFFEPWPAPQPDPGTADLLGLAASDGVVYSGFEAHPPKSFAILGDVPALNITVDNHVSLVHRKAGDPSGKSVEEPATLYNVLAGNEQVVAGGRVIARDIAWNKQPNPRTMAGIAANTLVVLVVDGRQPGVSEGLGVGEAAELLRRDYGVTEAISLDGGGSSTLCLADPVPRMANIPVGLHDAPNTLRPVGSNLAIFAPGIVPPVVATRPPPAASPPAADHRAIWLSGVGAVALVLLALGALAARKKSSR